MSTFINPYLEYISMFMESPKVAQKLQDLIDCLTLNDLLSIIPEFPIGQIQEAPLTFAQIFSNLKNTYKRMELFWNDVLQKQIQCREVDLVDIAHNGNQKQFIKIIDLFIQSAVLSSQKQLFVQKILQTSPSTQQFFMKIVERTLEQRVTFSPRKKRQQRLIDKMVQLEHQNENLQNVISQVCQERFQIQQRYRQIYDKIAEKDSQILKLSDEQTGLFATPQRKKITGIYDSMQKNNEYIERLKSKIIQMTKEHEKQVFSLNEKLQCYQHKVSKLDELENYIDMYKVRIQANQQALQQYQAKQKEYLLAKLSNIEKDEIISEYGKKLTKKAEKIQSLQEALLEKSIEIEKKNAQIQQLSKLTKAESYISDNEDSFLKITPICLQKSISVFQAETKSRIDDFQSANKNLKIQLEEVLEQMKEKQQQIQKYRKLVHQLKIKNRKLSDIIQEKIQRDGEISGVCLKSLKCITRDKLIRKKLQTTIETASNLNSRISKSKNWANKENQSTNINQSKVRQYSECYSLDKNKNSNKKLASTTLAKKVSFFSKQ